MIYNRAAARCSWHDVNTSSLSAGSPSYPSSQLSNKSAIVRLRCRPWYRMYLKINFSSGFMFNTNVKILVNIKTLWSCTVSLQVLVCYPEYVFEGAPNILLWWSIPNNFGILFYFPYNFRKQRLIKRYTFIRQFFFNS